MNIGIDFHDTLSYSPKFFRTLALLWPGKIYIVTGTPESYRQSVEEDLELLGFKGLYEDILMGFEYKKSSMSTNHFKKMREHKLQLLKNNDISIYFDDNPFYADWIRNHDIITFMLCVDNSYMERFAKADPFFTCHLQEEMFKFLDIIDDNKVKKGGTDND